MTKQQKDEVVRYLFSVPKPKSIKPLEIVRILPTTFTYREGESSDTIILEVDGTASDDVARDVARFEVARECDRIYFLTGEHLSPILTGKESNGVGEGYSSLRFEVSLVKPLDTNIAPQEWTSRLAVQLNLWRLGTQKGLDITQKIRFLFQIIESIFPDIRDRLLYPKYPDPSVPPSPRTESKLLRDLVSHQGADIFSDDLKNYCRFLGRSTEKFFDPTDSKDWTIVKQRLTVIVKVARDAIDVTITRHS
jgi:hypothetical protein